MAQLLLISPKLFYTGAYQQGLCFDNDIVQIFEDNHIFSDLEKNQFHIITIEGFTKTEIKDLIKVKKPEEKNINLIAGLWFEENIKEYEGMKPVVIKEIYKGLDGKWFFLNKKDKYLMTMSDLSSKDFDDLASKFISNENKLKILNKMKHRILEKPENLIGVGPIMEVSLGD